MVIKLYWLNWFNYYQSMIIYVSKDALLNDANLKTNRII